MIINRFMMPSNIGDYEYGEDYKLNYRDNLVYLELLGIEEIWYWYRAGSYEGNGQLLMRKGTYYCLIDLGHCSCFGPIEEDVVFTKRSLEEIERSLTESYKKQVQVLLDAAKVKTKPEWEV